MAENKKVEISGGTLILEVTRKCNMNPLCGHCLRGNPQNCNMPTNVIDNCFVDELDLYGFGYGGGEPTLNGKGCLYFSNVVKDMGLEYASLSAVTNAIRWDDDFIKSVENFYHNSISPTEVAIGTSFDPFHTGQNKEIIERYEYLFANNWTANHNPHAVGIINRGKAKENFHSENTTYKGFIPCNIVEKPVQMNPHYIYNIEENRCIYLSESVIYVSVKGDVFFDCDLSYDMMDSGKYSIGNVLEQGSLKNVLIEHFYDLGYFADEDSLEELLGLQLAS